MGIGLSILLLAAGAILSFAVGTTTYNGVDVHVVGWILMGAGALGLIWSLLISLTRRQTVVLEPRHDGSDRFVESNRVVDRELPADSMVRRETP